MSSIMPFFSFMSISIFNQSSHTLATSGNYIFSAKSSRISNTVRIPRRFGFTLKFMNGADGFFAKYSYALEDCPVLAAVHRLSY
jgi:hypothetical protein